MLYTKIPIKPTYSIPYTFWAVLSVAQGRLLPLLCPLLCPLLTVTYRYICICPLLTRYICICPLLTVTYRYLLGSAISGAGDVNSDGFDDIVLGSGTADPNGRYVS
jgi:hypothetical protein